MGWIEHRFYLSCIYLDCKEVGAGEILLPMQMMVNERRYFGFRVFLESLENERQSILGPRHHDEVGTMLVMR